MVVKVRFPRGARMERNGGKHAPLASVAGGLMTMLAVSCLLLAMWRLTSDVGWTDTFVIESGILSHWQVWLALTFATGAAAIRLTRYGHPAPERPAEEVAPPRELPSTLATRPRRRERTRSKAASR